MIPNIIPFPKRAHPTFRSIEDIVRENQQTREKENEEIYRRLDSILSKIKKEGE